MKVYLIRHGQTDWNLQGRIQGTCDIDLNQTGIWQAEELCKKFSECGYSFTKIYSSTQKRAARTAQILSEALRVEFLQVEGLEEMNLGEWEGLTWDEVKERYPTEFNRWYHNRRTTKAPNGESYQDMLERVLEAIRTILDENSDDVALVTHGAVIMALQCYLTHTPFDEMTKFKADNSTFTALDSEVLKNAILNVQ